LDLLSLIIEGFNEDSLVMAEAGTGVGKSFAYLLPAMHFALANKEKVVISTATITLQQQLYEKDIPLVASSISEETGNQVKIKSVIMKGRGNYLCQRRLEETLREPPLFEIDGNELNFVANWARSSKTGAKTDLGIIPQDSLWASVCSESDLCLGNHCPWRAECFIQNLRKEAAGAHIIVVNHHLLFADLAARFQGAGYENSVVLPPFSRLIIDEAHTIENAATSFFSTGFGRNSIFRQLLKLYYRKRTNQNGLLIKLCAIAKIKDDVLDSMIDATKKIRSSIENLDERALDFCGQDGIFRLSSACDESQLNKTLFPQFKSLKKEIQNLTNMIRDITENLDEEQSADITVWEIKAIMRRLEGTAEICDAFCKYKKHENDVLWIEKVSSYKDYSAMFTRTPLDLSPILKNSVFSPNKTVICVSATLAVNNDFSYWAAGCGIADLEDRPLLSGCFPSPFPYSNAVLLAAPSDSPLPDENGFQEFVNNSAKELAAIAGGSALILFTSYQSLTSAYNAAKIELEKLGIRCLKQGDDDRTRLLQTFLADESSCLFATDSFWEGVDAPGDTLRLVIICRLPFRTPGDPVFEARREAVEKLGENPFMRLSLPQAVIKFKQGFGRLMRRSADKGVVAVLDGRIHRKSYGQLFLQSLPETKINFGEFNNILIDVENFLFC